MNQHDNVERRLRAWMADAAPTREPAGLVDRTVTRAADVKQRPAAFSRTGLRERRFALPALAPAARWLVLALALLAATVAAVAVGSRALVIPVESQPRLVFVLDSDVYVADEDGSDPVRIVDGQPDAECGALIGNAGLVSPVGSRIAYRSEWDDVCSGMVFISDLDGQRIVSVPGAGWDIAWSPDGSRIATWLSFGESIAVYGIDGDLQAVLDGSMSCCGDYDPRWSVDGTSLLVPGWADAGGRISEGGTVLTGTDRPGVIRLALDGGKPEVVSVDDLESHRSVAYSPDGTYAAYEVARPWPEALPYGSDEGLAQAQLVVVATDGSRPDTVVEFEPGEQVDGGWFSRPAWSPDGDQVAVVTTRYSTDPAGNPIRQQSASVRVVDVGTGLVTMVASLEGEGSLTPVAFSPDGDRILVDAHPADATQSLSSVSVDGSGATVLVEGADAGAWVSPPVDG